MLQKKLGNQKDVTVTVIDRRNHHLFQPLLYQVAMAGLSPAEIAVPIRTLLSKYKNIDVLLGNVESVDFANQKIQSDINHFNYSFDCESCSVGNRCR